MTDAQKRGRSSRRKGGEGERQLAKLFREVYGYTDAHRGYTFHHESDIVGLDGIHCEVKRVEKLNISNAMRQAIDEANKRHDGRPTVFHKKNRESWMVTMLLDDWMQLYDEFYKNQKDL